MPETMTPTHQRRQMPSVRPLTPKLEPLAPEPVRDASRVLTERQAELAAANEKIRVAREAADAAPGEDRKAAAQAAEEGKSSMPKPTLPAAEATLAAALRAQEAARDVCIAAADLYICAAREHHAEFTAALAAELESEAALVAEDFQRLEGALLRARELRYAQAALGESPAWLEGRAAGFEPVRSEKRLQRDQLRDLRGHIDALREAVGL